jgi:hypothetical protein
MSPCGLSKRKCAAGSLDRVPLANRVQKRRQTCAKHQHRSPDYWTVTCSFSCSSTELKGDVMCSLELHGHCSGQDQANQQNTDTMFHMPLQHNEVPQAE